MSKIPYVFSTVGMFGSESVATLSSDEIKAKVDRLMAMAALELKYSPNDFNTDSTATFIFNDIYPLPVKVVSEVGKYAAADKFPIAISL